MQGDFTSYAWSRDGEPIPGADDPFYVASTGGTYSVVVTTDLGCVLTGEYVLLITGLLQEGWLTELQVHPNPNRGQFTLELSSDISQLASIKVFDPSGRLCHEVLRNGTPKQVITLQNASPGRYILLVEAGGKRGTVAVVVE